jgi:uncharacterized protein YacL
MDALVLLLTLQAADVVTTFLALQNKNNMEANPILRALFNKVGLLPGLLVAKLGFIALLCIFRHDVHPYAMYALCVGYAYIVYNNIKVLKSTP